MPDMVTTGETAGKLMGNGTLAGGLGGTFVWLVKELIAVIRGKTYPTRREVKRAIEESEARVKEAAGAAAKALEEKTAEAAKEIREKADEQDIKIGILEHQKACLAEQKADMKDFQAKIVMSFSGIQETVSKMQENHTDSFRRMHTRIDEVKKEIMDMAKELAKK